MSNERKKQSSFTLTQKEIDTLKKLELFLSNKVGWKLGKSGTVGIAIRFLAERAGVIQNKDAGRFLGIK